MSFSDNVGALQKKLDRVGYSQIYEQWDISSIKNQDAVIDCAIIAKKHFFNILYLEVNSNWKSLSAEVAKKNENACLVITRYGDSHIIFAILKDHNTLHPKPEYIVMDITDPKQFNNFIKSIKTDVNDTLVQIDKKVQKAFDKFSEYKSALNEFGKNLDKIIKNTKEIVDIHIEKNEEYIIEANNLLKICQEIINDTMELNDIKDILIQHILTYRIFAMVYDEHDFHNTNTIAKSVEKLKQLLKIPDDIVDYKTMELIAESIIDTDQKQEFLKKIYEEFYKKYDPAKADKEGIVYTPSEVVNFMVKSANQLLKRHFSKNISDNNVIILDPATGTGTFLVHILREINREHLKLKYEKELHANEISILPYYIAALNIEHTYKELTCEYKEFENICWTDTLDGGMKNYENISTYFDDNDNVKRISRQQTKKICLIIGNPPYNAAQTSLNNANPTDKYPHIDKLIREDYSKLGKTQNKNRLFDMYKRFLKWSSERIKGNGMIVFISNNSFLDGKDDDGIRRALYDEFDYIYTVNLKGKSRNVSGDIAKKEGGNVFNVRVGITISFFIKTNEKHSEIQYAEIPNYMKKDKKLEWLNAHTISTLKLNEIIPDKEAFWLNQPNNDFSKLIPIFKDKHEEFIFNYQSIGTSSAKDEWTHDFDQTNLIKKIKYYIKIYDEILKKYRLEKSKIVDFMKWVDKTIKWSSRTVECIESNQTIKFSKNNIKKTLYRPFVIKHQYYDPIITHRISGFPVIFKNSQENLLILFTNPRTNTKFDTIGTNIIASYDCVANAKCIPLYQYNDENKKESNITHYALKYFQNRYKNDKITDENIFYYIYAIFNDPKYEKKYKHNLEKSLPRIPFTKNFMEYSRIGKQLFNLHCNFNEVSEYKLVRKDILTKNNKVKLQIKKEHINKKLKIKIIIDEKTTLYDVPPEIFEYIIGSKNPLEWILEFYAERKNIMSEKRGSINKEIRKKFTIYKFLDYKEEVIILLKKVITICVETVKLRKELELLEWGPQPDLNLTPIEKKESKKYTKKPKKSNVKKASASKLKRSKKEKIRDEVLASNNQTTFDNAVSK